jgi:hypothetical protein
MYISLAIHWLTEVEKLLAGIVAMHAAVDLFYLKGPHLGLDTIHA